MFACLRFSKLAPRNKFSPKTHLVISACRHAGCICPEGSGWTGPFCEMRDPSFDGTGEPQQPQQETKDQPDDTTNVVSPATPPDTPANVTNNSQASPPSDNSSNDSGDGQSKIKTGVHIITKTETVHLGTWEIVGVVVFLVLFGAVVSLSTFLITRRCTTRKQRRQQKFWAWSSQYMDQEFNSPVIHSTDKEKDFTTEHPLHLQLSQQQPPPTRRPAAGGDATTTDEEGGFSSSDDDDSAQPPQVNFF